MRTSSPGARSRGALQVAGMVAVAEARHGREAVELGLHYRPEVILVDVVMPGLDGVLATRRILKANRDQHVVALTGGSGGRAGPAGSARGARPGFFPRALS